MPLRYFRPLAAALAEVTPNRSLLQLQPDIIVTKISQSMSSQIIAPPDDHFKSQSCNRATRESAPVVNLKHSIKGRSRSHVSQFRLGPFTIVKKVTSPEENDSESSWTEERAKHVMSIRGPIWLVNRMWEVHSTQAYCGWNIKLRSYNIVSQDSLVFKYASERNIDGLRELFSKGLASPFDRSEHGETPLHVSDIRQGTFNCTLRYYSWRQAP